MSTQPEPMPLATATAEPVGESGLQEKKNSARVQDVEADEDMKNLDVIEQKMVLINRVINSQGMGRYQVSIRTFRHKPVVPFILNQYLTPNSSA